MEEKNQQKGIRINKYLSEAGVCSRRAADREIEAGNVQIGTRQARAGDRVMPGEIVFFCGKPVQTEEESILLAFHKPRGIVCTAEKREKNNIIDYINYPKRIYPMGRLDKDSEGLILMTNQGDLVNRMMRAGNYHEKEYIVSVDREVTEDFLRGMAGGVFLSELNVTTRPCRVEKTGKYAFRIILTQGYNRQIRRMCQVFGRRVTRLVRVRIMNIELGDLKAGRWREVTDQERRELYRRIRNSYSAPRQEENRKDPVSRTGENEDRWRR